MSFAVWLHGLTASCHVGHWIWAIFWFSFNVVVYLLVVYALQDMKSDKRIYLVPALIMSIINVVAGVIDIIVNLVVFNWFG